MVLDSSKLVEVLQEIGETDPRTRVIRFRRNFGQTAAQGVTLEFSTPLTVGRYESSYPDQLPEVAELRQRVLVDQRPCQEDVRRLYVPVLAASTYKN